MQNENFINKVLECRKKNWSSSSAREHDTQEKNEPCEAKEVQAETRGVQRKKNQVISGSQKSGNHGKEASETRYLVIHLEDQQLDKDREEELADGIPQLDGNGYSTSESISVDEEASFTFVSNYAEEDINDALKELKDDNLVPNLPTLISRVQVQPRSADHLCTVLLNIPVTVVNFVWPELRGYPDCEFLFSV